MNTCSLTGATLQEPLYRSKSQSSITSLSTVYQGMTEVYYSPLIGHLQTKEIENIERYYDEQYQFFTNSDEDDILYAIIDGKKIFRQEHQVQTLLQKLTLPPGALILDYGCAKGTVMRRLASQRPDVRVHLFDVSKMYLPIWQQFTHEVQWSVYDPKPEWVETFDVITSFFAFEHVADPLKELRTIKKLLKPGGIFYGIVPDVYQNIGDFIVADHIQHYSEQSLRFLLARCGFECLEIDSTSHNGAFIVIGRATNDDALPFIPDANRIMSLSKKTAEIAQYWSEIQEKIRTFEHQHHGKKAVIYGAGVYGNFIAASLENIDNILCFIDQNPLLTQTSSWNKKVCAVSNLPQDAHLVYVGLNPTLAKDIIHSIPEWSNKLLEYFFI